MSKHSLIGNIRKEVIKANPSILDLVFGCKIIDTNSKHFTIIGSEPARLGGIIYYVGIETSIGMRTGEVSSFHNGYIEKILGRTIGIADVLLAIGDEPVNFFYYSTGEVRMDYLDKDDKEISIYWNLKEDNLELQSEETLQFINNLTTTF